MSSSSHLTYPTPTACDAEPTAVPLAQPRAISRNRLYIGNLHPTVDEYTLLRIFSKYGKVTNLDFLFHKSGPCKGKPRGFAFIEYSDQQDAHRAFSTAHDKVLRGRKLVVTFAHQAPLDADGSKDNSIKMQNRFYDSGRSTTLSLLKSGTSNKPARTQDKIVILEAKLQQLERSRTAGSTSSNEGTRILPHPHPSLPSIPSPSTSQSVFTRRSNSHQAISSSTASISTTSLPALPISSQESKGKLPLTVQHAQTSGTTGKGRSYHMTQRFASSGLVGVKIKPKERIEHKKRDEDNVVADPAGSSEEKALVTPQL